MSREEEIRVLLTNYFCHLFSHVTKVYESLFLFSTEQRTRDYEMQSNKAALSPRNAPFAVQYKSQCATMSKHEATI